MTDSAACIDAEVEIDVDRLATLGMVSASLSHEIANALALFQFAIDELADSTSHGRVPATETVELLVVGRDRLIAQTGSALRLAGQVGREPTRHELGDVVRELADVVRRAGVIRHATLDVAIGSGELAVVAGRGELDQLVLGLVIAAVDDVHARGTAGSIAIDVRRTAETVCIEVRDNGTNVPHGLGLAIARRLVVGLDGTLDVARTAVGAMVTVSLPAAHAKAPRRSGLRGTVPFVLKHP